MDRQDSTTLPSGGQGNGVAEWEKNDAATQVKERELKQVTGEILGLALFVLPSTVSQIFPPAGTEILPFVSTM